MELKNAFEEIFNSLDSSSEEQASISTSGTIPFLCPLDSNGNYDNSFSKNGFGKTVYCNIKFTYPDNTIFTVTIKDSAQSAPHKFTLKTNEMSPKFEISTKLIGETKVTYSVHATASNVIARGEIGYSLFK